MANITEDQIRALRTEAAQAGDRVQVHICDVALGDEEPVTTVREFKERYGGRGYGRRERAEIMNVTSREQAWDMCAQAIIDAQNIVSLITTFASVLLQHSRARSS